MQIAGEQASVVNGVAPAYLNERRRPQPMGRIPTGFHANGLPAGDDAIGIFDIDLDLPRGSFVITHRPDWIGQEHAAQGAAGVLADAGEVRWNGELVESPAGFLYTAALRLHRPNARLFNESAARQYSAGTDGNARRGTRNGRLRQPLSRSMWRRPSTRP
ncbi:MAG: hypothetical protein R2911_13995 [Caldilineaceae bacterium]